MGISKMQEKQQQKRAIKKKGLKKKGEMQDKQQTKKKGQNKDSKKQKRPIQDVVPGIPVLAKKRSQRGKVMFQLRQAGRSALGFFSAGPCSFRTEERARLAAEAVAGFLSNGFPPAHLEKAKSALLKGEQVSHAGCGFQLSK